MTIYDGEWKDHKMHGEGQFIDRKGQKWESLWMEFISLRCKNI